MRLISRSPVDLDESGHRPLEGVHDDVGVLAHGAQAGERQHLGHLDPA